MCVCVCVCVHVCACEAECMNTVCCVRIQNPINVCFISII